MYTPTTETTPLRSFNTQTYGSRYKRLYGNIRDFEALSDKQQESKAASTPAPQPVSIQQEAAAA